MIVFAWMLQHMLKSATNITICWNTVTLSTMHKKSYLDSYGTKLARLVKMLLAHTHTHTILAFACWLRCRLWVIHIKGSWIEMYDQSVCQGSELQTGRGVTQTYWCTHIGTKTCEKGSFLYYNTYSIFYVEGPENVDFQEEGVFIKNLVSLGGQIWCETPQNPCLWIFSWGNLKLV